MGAEIEKTLIRAVLVFLVRDDHFALARKMKKIGQGKLNSYGGGREEGETSRRATVRELEEESRRTKGETGIIANEKDLEQVATCYFKNNKSNGESFVCRVDVFLLKNWIGQLVSTEDMLHPAWYLKEKPPLNQMMLADRRWIPEILSGKKVIVHAEYGPRQETLIGEVKIDYVDSFPEE